MARLIIDCLFFIRFKVFRGYGKNVQTVNGEIFGPCAVKTVTEETSSSERLHFLLEASVMKQVSYIRINLSLLSIISIK